MIHYHPSPYCLSLGLLQCASSMGSPFSLVWGPRPEWICCHHIAPVLQNPLFNREEAKALKVTYQTTPHEQAPRYLLTHLLLRSLPEHQPHCCSFSEAGSPASYAPALLPLPSSLWALPYPPDVKPQPPPSPVLLHFAALLSPSTHQNTIYILLIHCAFITQWNKFHKGRNFFTVVGAKTVPSTVSSRSITVEKVNLSHCSHSHNTTSPPPLLNGLKSHKSSWVANKSKDHYTLVCQHVMPWVYFVRILSQFFPGGIKNLKDNVCHWTGHSDFGTDKALVVVC